MDLLSVNWQVITIVCVFLLFLKGKLLSVLVLQICINTVHKDLPYYHMYVLPLLFWDRYRKCHLHRKDGPSPGSCTAIPPSRLARAAGRHKAHRWENGVLRIHI